MSESPSYCTKSPALLHVQNTHYIHNYILKHIYMHNHNYVRTGGRFIFSGSDDEMVHIHDIAGLGGRSSAVGRVVGVAGEAGTVNPPLRCLHDARGSEIARVVCLQETPLAFAEVWFGLRFFLVGKVQPFSLIMGVPVCDAQLDF